LEQLELHNRIVGDIVRSIVKPPIEAGGSHVDVLILLESVVVGVCAFAVKMGGDEKVLDVVIDGARGRLAEMRLGSAKPEGSA
jgi:hypothetical protein